jgi:hypothetical protein
MKSRAIILGCGDSGYQYRSQPDDYVYGVNDAGKFGHPLDTLVFINRPSQFSKERLDIIANTRVSRVLCLHTNTVHWDKYFPFCEKLPMLERWRSAGRYYREKVYHTENSPFTALSLAIHEGYTEIVLFGVDFVDHKYLNPQDCVPQYSQVATKVEQYGIKIYKGSKYSNLNLPLWPSGQQ